MGSYGGRARRAVEVYHLAEIRSILINFRGIMKFRIGKFLI